MATPCLPANQLFRRFLLSVALLLYVAQAHAGLVLHYQFDETSGTTASDSSGSGYTGTLTNMTGSEWTTGKVGGALSFDGSNDRITVPIAALDGATAFSAAMWINLDAAGFSGDQYWLSVAHAGDDNEVLVGVNGNKIRWYFDDIVEPDSFSVAGWPSTWKHLVLARPSALNLMNIYVDGSLIHTENISSTVVSVDPNGLWIGGDQDSVGGGFNSGQQFDGLMDDFRIYDHELSASEVSALYSGGGAPEPAETFAFLGLLTAFGLGYREWRSRRMAKAA